MTESVIIEIRAGVGGEEAALFAYDIFKMYSKYAQNQGWGFKVLDLNQTEIKGIKQITFEIKGKDALNKMKYEGGVHRVQRIPRTEKSNRIHTSTISVAVLKKPQTTEIKINPIDIKMDYFRASGPGGQNVNKRQTAVRITHVPSGLVVSSQVQRNLEQNKQAALTILRAKLFAKEQEKVEGEIGEERRAQIGQTKRAEKIRTYNFPQDRLTDHRIKKTWYNIEKIMSGGLDKIIEKLQRNLNY